MIYQCWCVQKQGFSNENGWPWGNQEWYLIHPYPWCFLISQNGRMIAVRPADYAKTGGYRVYQGPTGRWDKTWSHAPVWVTGRYLHQFIHYMFVAVCLHFLVGDVVFPVAVWYGQLWFEYHLIYCSLAAQTVKTLGLWIKNLHEVTHLFFRYLSL